MFVSYVAAPFLRHFVNRFLQSLNILAPHCVTLLKVSK